jgi:hypothetical protein
VRSCRADASKVEINAVETNSRYLLRVLEEFRPLYNFTRDRSIIPEGFVDLEALDLAR